MKFILFPLMLFLAVPFAIQGQSFRGLDKSPMDLAYFPDNFAHDRKGDQEAIFKIYYSRPLKKGRTIFGEKVAYGKVWRTGANEAPELKVYKKITIGGEKLKRGTYSLFTIPNKDSWTIIISSDLDYWGAYSYNSENDILRIEVPVKSLSKVIEAFSIRIEESGENAAVMRLAWDKASVEIPINY